MVSATVAFLPAAVSLLLLEAIFMQISGVSLALTWPCRLCLLRFLLCGSLCYKLSPFQALGKVTLHLCSQACMFIYSSCGRWVFPPLLWSFPPSATLTSFPAPGCWARAPAPTRASLARLACLFTVPGRIPFPQSSALSVPHPLSCVSYLFSLLITQFLFFPRVEVSLSRGLWCSSPGLSVGVLWYCKGHQVCVFPSCLCAGDWRPGGPPGFSV
jgi:hypothetical protein